MRVNCLNIMEPDNTRTRIIRNVTNNNLKCSWHICTSSIQHFKFNVRLFSRNSKINLISILSILFEIIDVL
jgi:hypothetical protein